MRIVSFNIQHGRTPGGIVDLDALGRACAGLDADILGLQEVDVGLSRSGHADLPAVVAEATGRAGVFGVATRMFEGDYGNALLARGEIRDVDVVPLPNPKGLEPRSALLASVVVQGAGGPVSVAVVHLSFEPAEAMVQLPLVVAALVDRPGPRVLLGDFNLRAPAVAPAVHAHGFTLVRDGGSTFPAHRPRVRIDHVATTGLTTGSVSTPRLPVSDHRALVVEAFEPMPAASPAN